MATQIEPIDIAPDQLPTKKFDETIIPSDLIHNIGGSKSSIQGSFQSPGFISGSTGWRLTSAGDLEANSGTFRGTLSAASGTLGAITVGTNAWHIDSSGNIWWGSSSTYAGATIKISSAGSVDLTTGNFSGTLVAPIGSLGLITTGLITLDNTGYLKGGQTDYNTGTGFFLGYSTDAYKFSIGNPDGHYLTWDGSDIVGKFNVKSYDTWITGQEVSAGDYVFISDDATTEISVKKWFNNGTEGGTPGYSNFGTSSGTTIAAQSFTIAGSGTIAITKVRLKIEDYGPGNPNTFRITIQAGADNPDGTPLGTTGYLAYNNASPNSPDYTYLSFTSPITLTAGTKYWIVADTSAGSDTDYYRMYYISPAHYSSGWATYSGSWTTGTNVNYLFELYANTVVGRAYRASAIAAATYDNRFGFVVADSNYGTTTDIQHSGIYTTTGLTVGTYYLKDETKADNDVGQIGTVAGSNSVVVGLAYNTIKLKIKEP